MMGLQWWLVGVIMVITVIGIPWARACFVIGNFSFFPFGREVVSRKVLTGQEDIGTGDWGLLGNFIWFCLGGIWLVIGHLLWALFFTITIIGIPFAVQHLKLAGLAIAPIGITIVPRQVLQRARRVQAQQFLAINHQ